tara:strand:- start:6263 stop:6754 length:492 start_codon:yes stop_codon:yes gene_type:complete
MSNKLNISEEVLNKLILNVFNIGTDHNSKHIESIIINRLPDYAKEIILHLACVGSDYTPVYPGDFIKVQPPGYHAGSEFEWDVLTDLGLNAGDGYVYGTVIGDGSYKNIDEYDPFYSLIKVNLMYHDADRNSKSFEYSVSPTDLIKVNEEDIKYLDIIHELDA